jgi:hypothetical protein
VSEGNKVKPIKGTTEWLNSSESPMRGQAMRGGEGPVSRIGENREIVVHR